MKKLVTLFLALLLCISVLAASLQAVTYVATADSDPKPTVTIPPEDPDGLNTFPPGEETDKKE